MTTRTLDPPDLPSADDPSENQPLPLTAEERLLLAMQDYPEAPTEAPPMTEEEEAMWAAWREFKGKYLREIFG